MNKTQQFIDKLNNEYLELHTKESEREYLIQENNVEKRDIRGYHGREILELLQNADDAFERSKISKGKINCELEVSIQFSNNILTVSNTGTVFDESGIKSIIQGNVSDKKGKYIGNKGTGFRSVLNWADKIRIYSGDVNVEFSKEISISTLDSIKEFPQIKKQIDKYPNLYIPILAIARNIEKKNLCLIQL